MEFFTSRQEERPLLLPANVGVAFKVSEGLKDWALYVWALALPIYFTAFEFMRVFSDVHPNVRAYWSDPSELSQLMATGEVLVAGRLGDFSMPALHPLVDRIELLGDLVLGRRSAIGLASPARVHSVWGPIGT